jgi:hypothetical protein
MKSGANRFVFSGGKHLSPRRLTFFFPFLNLIYRTIGLKEKP